MEILCPQCGAENWLENQSRCFQCGTVLRRCVDCSHYDSAEHFCRNLESEIDLGEAEHPTLLATSTSCDRYRRYLGQRSAP